MRRFSDWLQNRWSGQEHTEEEIAEAYRQTFTTAAGRIVLQDLMDTIYATVSPSTNAEELAAHNGQRSVVHLILQRIDKAENPKKWAGK